MKVKGTNVNIKASGRIYTHDEVVYLNYSCTSLEFDCISQKVSVRLWTDGNQGEKMFQARMAVFINYEEEPSKRFILEETEKDYILYESSTSQKVHIKLMKLSEAAFSKVAVKEFDIVGEIVPLEIQAKAHKIEFIGDSITCGYGIEGIWNKDTFTTHQEDPWKAYAARTARYFDADFHLISWSGIGIISSWTDNGELNNEWVMPMLYPYTDRGLENTLQHKVYEKWDFNKFKPDCIVVNLGTNDKSYTGENKQLIDAFGEKYYEFLKVIRENNPQAMIICTLGVMGQELLPEINKQVARFSLEQKDSKIIAMPFEMQEEKDGIGADWHPSEKTHQKMTAQLVETIGTVMHWEKAK
nr:SGNH/GDSL hydrolase family protein [uncultured Cellulosilyticum sp.]